MNPVLEQIETLKRLKEEFYDFRYEIQNKMNVFSQQINYLGKAGLPDSVLEHYWKEYYTPLDDKFQDVYKDIDGNLIFIDRLIDQFITFLGEQ